MRRQPLALTLAAALCSTWAAAAQDAATAPAPAAQPVAEATPAAVDLPVGVDVTLGFGNRVPQDGFLSVAVDLTNQGAPVNAVVTLRAIEGGNVLLRLGPVELEAAARRRLVGVVPAKPVLEAGELHAAVHDASSADERLLGLATVNPEGTPARLLVALDRRGGAPADLSSLRTVEGQTAQGQPVELRWTALVASRLEDLPQSPLGYTGLGAVLVGDLELEGWPEPEARALAAWVARGGHLVLSVGPRARLLRGRSLLGRFLGPALRPLPDAPPLRDVPLDGLFASLRATFDLDDGGAAVPPAPTFASLLPGPEDLVLLRAGDHPFAVRRQHGLGRVTLVAADLWAPPFLHSPVTARLLEALLAGGPTYSPRSRMLFGELADVRQPARVGPAFAVLIIYALVVGPGVYFVLRARKRGILLWVVIPAGTVVCTALVPLYRIALRDAESTLVGVRLVEGWSGQPLTVETADVLLFSGSLEPKRFEYEAADAVSFAVIPPRRRGAPELGPVLGAGAEGASFSLPVALWGARYLSFEAGGTTALAQGHVQVSTPPAEDPNAEPVAHVRVSWDGPTLRDAFVLYPAGAAGAVAHQLGRPLAPGEAVDEPARPQNPSSIEANESDLGALVIERLVASHYLGETEGRRVAYLIGQIDARPPLEVLPNVRTRTFSTIVAIELPVVYHGAVPFGVARVVREAATVAAIGSGTIEREVRTRLLLPDAAGREPAAARLRVTSHRTISTSRMRVGAFDWRAQAWVPLLPREEGDVPEPASTGRRVELSLDDPARFVSPDGVVLVRQRFIRGRQDGDEAHAATIDVSVEWKRE